MKYVKRLEDTSLWKKQFENSGKGVGNMEGNYYVVNQSGRGETTQLIPPVAQDIIAAKSQIKRKRKTRKNKKKKIIRKKRRVKKRIKKRKIIRGRVVKRKKTKKKRNK